MAKEAGRSHFSASINEEGFAGSLSWVLVVGYVLTNAVYAFTFGQYLGYVVVWALGFLARLRWRSWLSLSA